MGGLGEGRGKEVQERLSGKVFPMVSKEAKTEDTLLVSTGKVAELDGM